MVFDGFLGVPLVHGGSGRGFGGFMGCMGWGGGFFEGIRAAGGKLV